MWIFSSEHLGNSLNRRSYANTKNKYIWAKYHVDFPCLQIKGRRRDPYFNELNVNFIELFYRNHIRRLWIVSNKRIDQSHSIIQLRVFLYLLWMTLHMRHYFLMGFMFPLNYNFQNAYQKQSGIYCQRRFWWDSPSQVTVSISFTPCCKFLSIKSITRRVW